MKGWQFKKHRCVVCRRVAFFGTQARPLCYHCEETERKQKLDYCCTCGCILKNVPDELKGCDDLLCVDCMKKEKERTK